MFKDTVAWEFFQVSSFNSFNLAPDAGFLILTKLLEGFCSSPMTQSWQKGLDHIEN
jgi:hypothetical protein